MGIQTKQHVTRVAEQDFYKIDHQVMRLAFDIHNEIGRLWDEKIYHTELANRCHKAGFANIEIEVPVTVVYQSFAKKIFC